MTNVPFILVVLEEVDKLPDKTLAWELLAMASTFADSLYVGMTSQTRGFSGTARC